MTEARASRMTDIDRAKESDLMARADQNNLRRSGVDAQRQQRDEQPNVPGASGSEEDNSSEAAEVEARKRVGKTRKHTSEDTLAP